MHAMPTILHDILISRYITLNFGSQQPYLSHRRLFQALSPCYLRLLSFFLSGKFTDGKERRPISHLQHPFRSSLFRFSLIKSIDKIRWLFIRVLFHALTSTIPWRGHCCRYKFYQQVVNLWPLLSTRGGVLLGTPDKQSYSRSLIGSPALQRKSNVQHDARVRGNESAAYDVPDDTTDVLSLL